MMKRAIIARAIAAIAAGLICADTVLGTGADTTSRQILYVVFACSALTSIVMLVRLRQDFEVPRKPVRIQIVFDVLIVTVLVYFSGGVYSMLPLLYIIVVLETGILLSRVDGLIVATLSSAAIVAMLALERLGVHISQVPSITYTAPNLGPWPDALIYIFALYLTAFISGYWSFKLRRMLDFQRGLLNYLNSGFLITDENGHIQTFNLAAQKMLGYSLPAAMNRPVSEVLKTTAGIDNPVEMTLRTGRELTSYELRGLRRDGSEVPLGITTSVIRDRKGRIEGVIASFADMTDLESARRKLQQRDRLAAIGRLSAGLAHEIRNPVASIRGAIEEMKNSLDDPETVRILAQIAIRESDQLNSIVTGFLDYARGASSEIGPVELRDIIQDVVSLLRRDCGSGQEIELDVPVSAVTVTGDYSRLKQAFLNIGKNAIEAMDTGGRLTITVRTENDSTAIVTFRDTGCGIDTDDMATIFEPFFTTKPDGVGMGMAVMHKIVTSHGGDVHIESARGQGTEVRTTFPLSENPDQHIDKHTEIALNANAPSPCN